MQTTEGVYRLGNAGFTGAPIEQRDGCSELWFSRPGQPPYRFRFRDTLRSDAITVIGQLRDQGRRLVILSGDHSEAVAEVATALGIHEWRAGLTPKAKADFILALKDQGRRILMVGDGLNDAAALGFADASLSPASGMDITQNVADAVFQGERLAAVPEFLGVAAQSQRLCKQNIAFSLVYNLFAVPLAIAGLVTPLIAAIAMSSSSLVVVANAVRLGLLVRKARP